MTGLKAPKVITIDFETYPIQQRPHYPPEPVGVSIKWPEEESQYLAWGHIAGANNCSKMAAMSELIDAWASDLPLLFHNAKFDVAVAVERLGFRNLPPWDRVHDTTFLTFLADPHMRKGGLKEVAEDLLGWAPEEQDAVKAWVLEHQKKLVKEFPQYRALNKKTGEPKNTIAPSEAGAWIFAAPGDLVGEYAKGDTDRTWALFEHLYPLVMENGMSRAYDRERQVLPIFMENEREGIRVDQDALEEDTNVLRMERRLVDEWLRKQLSAPDLNIDSDREYADVLAREGIVDDDKWTLTKTGQRSVSKDNLRPDMYNDPRIANAYGYRQRLGTVLKQFMEPWLAQASENNDYISTNWNQTRGEGGGTRTGRPSTSKPNFLNISKNFEGRSDGYQHPEFLGVPQLPLVRKYILPDEDSLFIHRDFDGQELRIFGHFEQGELFQQYQANPRIDVHDFVRQRVLELTGKEFERTIVKNINFGKIYGAGLARIMELMQCSRGEARDFDAIHAQALPGIKILNEEIKRLVRSGNPIKTWGGRLYYPEEPKQVKGRWMNFEYKLLNYLVQGSAADCTKEALIRWYNHPDRDKTDRFLVTVYDEINISARRDRWKTAMRVLQEAMESIEIEVDMLSSPKVGWDWGSCIGQKEDKATGWVEPEADFLIRAEKELGL